MTSQHRIQASPRAGEVSAILDRPDDARWLYVLGHGAGADMRHPSMQDTVRAFGAQGFATLRYQFPYTEKGSRRPDPQPTLLATVRSAVAFANEIAGGLPLLAGGKSMGGRMTSLAQAEEPLSGVCGLVFLGFPLHPTGAPATTRADHLSRVDVPMLFLQGSKDKLAGLDLLRPVPERLSRVTLHVIEGADHSFVVPKSSGRARADVFDELARTAATWAGKL
ncbi:MAG TPA: alpha/beta family hydrolase [Candidatus Eisenbacteria bacterium]|nr:alpha/beta family hydrolase [Candidatus Eisenbacteria bacterium]